MTSDPAAAVLRGLGGVAGATEEDAKMGEYMFGVHRGRLSNVEVNRRERIAGEHGVSFVQMRDPGQGWISWFSKPNEGFPFDRDAAALVKSDVDSGAADGRVSR